MQPRPLVIASDYGADIVVGAAAVLGGIWLGARLLAIIRREGWKPAGVAALALALVSLGGEVLLCIRHVGWQLRVDDEGITLRAPFDLQNPSRQIIWADLETVRFSAAGYRGPARQLHLVARNGREIVLLNAGKLPAKQLQEAIARYAGSTRGVPEMLESLDETSRSTSSSLSNGYHVVEQPPGMRN